MQPSGVHHVSINVSDVEAAVEFYTATLGLSVRADRPELGIEGAWLDAGAQQVHLIRAPIPQARGQHFALGVSDIREAVRELRDSGIEVSEPSVVGTSLQSFLADPSGNTVELHQPGAIS